MNIGISRPSHSLQEAYEILEQAHALGFEGVQLKPAQYSAFKHSSEAFRSHYGALSAMTAGGLIHYPGNNLANWQPDIGAVIRFAAATGAPHICICSGIYTTNAGDAEIRAVADALTAIGTEARQSGVIVSIHNHVDSIVESETDIAKLLDLLDPALCGLTLDTAHAAKAGIPSVESLVRRFRKHLLNVHLKDLAPDGRFCPLGQGTVPMQPILAALAEIGYQQWLIVDEETPDIPSAEALNLAHAFLVDHLMLQRR
ncbi:MAG: sugar phosphate isomerase/epimerase family protein [Candidatus Methylacidiphilales bacterium]